MSRKGSMADSRQSEFMSPDELAADLNVSTKHVRRLIKNGNIPHHRFGRLIRVHRDDRDEYVKSHRFK